MLKYLPILEFRDICIFDIFDHKVQILWPRCQATGVAMATILCPLV